MKGGFPMTIDTSTQKSVMDELLASRHRLRAFAISLSGNVDTADDLVQETLTRAVANITHFEPGSNMLAWLVTILRNLFYANYRKLRREVEDADGLYAASLTCQPGQESKVEFEELRRALDKMPADQREALILVGGSGFSYDEVARIQGCAPGTIKSRVNRARSRLAELLRVNLEEGLSAGPIMPGDFLRDVPSEQKRTASAPIASPAPQPSKQLPVMPSVRPYGPTVSRVRVSPTPVPPAAKQVVAIPKVEVEEAATTRMVIVTTRGAIRVAGDNYTHLCDFVVEGRRARLYAIEPGA